ncbi:dihydropteridine reductase-like [Paramacrobiotus metropolitanus]|uniref:dihydropteridine reductase-like n=1 Tax=Paramacrobiotus metropolitanus TaxID=2943436 RepID=UPI00244570D9|nr:dihydropteridine reductase-like [Paramacrobiotus metropolitanus]
MATQSAKKVIVYGGRGALGNAIVQHFKAQGWWVGSVDLHANDEAHGNVAITKHDSLLEQEQEILAGVKNLVGDGQVDAILCVAGGWAGGNIADKDFVKNTDLVLKQSVWSSVIACRLSSAYLKPGGLLTLTGANSATEPTPGAVGYGLAKAAVHQLVKTLGAKGSGLPENSTAVAILPVMLDTPMNRKWMPTADFSTWTSLDYVADLLRQWSEGKTRPNNGSLVALITEKGETKLQYS